MCDLRILAHLEELEGIFSQLFVLGGLRRLDVLGRPLLVEDSCLTCQNESVKSPFCDSIDAEAAQSLGFDLDVSVAGVVVLLHLIREDEA